MLRVSATRWLLQKRVELRSPDQVQNNQIRIARFLAVATDQASDRATERPSDRVSERASDRARERPSDQATERPSDRAIKRFTESAPHLLLLDLHYNLIGCLTIEIFSSLGKEAYA